MRLLILTLLALAAPAFARDPLVGPPARYYGPLKTWWGVGYKHDVRPDGTWRIVTNARRLDGSDFAINTALFRAAQLAQENGAPYVQILSMQAMEGRQFGQQSAYLIVRPSGSPAAPEGCKPARCYTAVAAEVMRRLSGSAGDQPGVALPSYLDRYGRTVTVIGFGTGAAAPDGTPLPMALPVGAKPIPTLISSAPPQAAMVASAPAHSATALSARGLVRAGTPVPGRRTAPRSSYDALLQAEQGVRGGDTRQGWTISD